jgi:hypothetical protein
MPRAGVTAALISSARDPAILVQYPQSEEREPWSSWRACPGQLSRQVLIEMAGSVAGQDGKFGRTRPLFAATQPGEATHKIS